MSSYLLVSVEKQQDARTKRLQRDLDASLCYASFAQGLTPPPRIAKKIPPEKRNTILNFLTAAGLVPKGKGVNLGAILLHSRSEPEPPPASKHTLLSLPPEMRNPIYRFALVESQDVMIREEYNEDGLLPPPQEPALLFACRQIRDEALEIYWQENTFRVEVENLNAFFYKRWTRKSVTRYHSNHSFSLTGNTDWWCLKDWLKSVYHSNCHGFDSENSNRDMAGGAHLFDVVANMRGNYSWRQVNEVLQKLRPVLVGHNAAWGSDIYWY